MSLETDPRPRHDHDLQVFAALPGLGALNEAAGWVVLGLLLPGKRALRPRPAPRSKHVPERAAADLLELNAKGERRVPRSP